MSKSQKKRQQRTRTRDRLFAEYKKNCSRCGSTDNLTFHHRDSATKLFNIGSASTQKTYTQLLAEILKCDVLCRTCHDEVHNGEN